MTLDSLREVAPGVHVAEAPVRCFGLELGARMSVLDLSGGLLGCSPIAIDPAAAARLGKLRWVLAADLLHPLYVGAWIDAGREAWAAWGLPESRADLTFRGVIDPGAVPFGDDITLLPHGAPNSAKAASITGPLPCASQVAGAVRSPLRCKMLSGRARGPNPVPPLRDERIAEELLERRALDDVVARSSGRGGVQSCGDADGKQREALTAHKGLVLRCVDPDLTRDLRSALHRDRVLARVAGAEFPARTVRHGRTCTGLRSFSYRGAEVRLIYAHALAGDGASEAARQVIIDEVARVRATALRIPDPDVRQRDLHHMPANARRRQQARDWHVP